MQSDPPSSRSGSDEREVPPAVVCSVCGGWDCSTCESSATPKLDAAIAWEDAGGVAERLWRTAHATSADPRGVFGALGDGSVGSALAFAMLAETLAILSFALTLMLAALALAPAFSWRVITHPTGVAYLLGGALGVSAIMVALHAMWGACLAVAAGASRLGFRQSLRFGLYACGWDLVTSPAGVVEGFVRHGPLATLKSLSHAIHAPRPALDAYQANRHFEPSARRRALRLSVLVLGGTLLALLPLAALLLFDFAEWLFAL